MNTTRVNYEFARKLYHNEAEDYMLGAGFAKKIVTLQLVLWDCRVLKVKMRLRKNGWRSSLSRTEVACSGCIWMRSGKWIVSSG
ncbi:hypothetical protein [Paenibacillus rhizolycopersici]|uniref:hypothetical protein n=1 Tax=Paenibacillus rhizolycopersici TaxID=2780073 RepID=UPI003D280BA5